VFRGQEELLDAGGVRREDRVHVDEGDRPRGDRGGFERREALIFYCLLRLLVEVGDSRWMLKRLWLFHDMCIL
jgi:hypothetical protein